RVRAERVLVPWAVEETLRWETPVLFVARQSTRPVEIAGVHIPEGKFVSAVIASGNRDETHYPDPDRFDLDRRADDHLSFGFGRTWYAMPMYPATVPSYRPRSSARSTRRENSGGSRNVRSAPRGMRAITSGVNISVRTSAGWTVITWMPSGASS